ncbi:neurotrophin 1-like [Maniola hyperantus]|uniref:neurotrophin 1-like n=1 Tax=Aphantopus hyperantus TaxID=2795564 RepID=UPI003747FEE9
MRIIRTLLKRNVKFNEDIKQWDNYINSFEESPRIQEDEDLCRSKPELYTPQAARDASNKWHLILNSEGTRTTQNYIGEQCQPKSPNCSKMAHFSKSFYHGVCVQKFMKRVMYGLTDYGVIKTLFDVPSCCACVARRLA